MSAFQCLSHYNNCPTLTSGHLSRGLFLHPEKIILSLLSRVRSISLLSGFSTWTATGAGVMSCFLQKPYTKGYLLEKKRT